jgi:hypothetical protein
MMKKISMSRIVTFKRESTDIMIVLSRDCRPLYSKHSRQLRTHREDLTTTRLHLAAIRRWYRELKA